MDDDIWAMTLIFTAAHKFIVIMTLTPFFQSVTDFTCDTLKLET